MLAGQFFQTLYPHVNAMGSWLSYGRHPQAHMTQAHVPEATHGHASLRLYAEWRRYWNVSRPVLVEKSPIDMLKTLYLQSLFGSDRTMFLVVLRHPMATLRKLIADNPRYFRDCGDTYLQHWLLLHETMLKDLVDIKHTALVHFEHLALGDTQRLQLLIQLISLALISIPSQIFSVRFCSSST